MASGSRQSGLETRSETTLFDPVLTSWMSREQPPGEPGTFEEEVDESKKKEVDPEGELRELFRIFDKHHDNTICCSELGKMLRCMGMEVTDVEVSNIMRALDRNGNGKIEYREFKSFIQEEMRRIEECPREQKKAIRLAFRVFDYNEDGFIDATELKMALQNLGEPLSEKELSDLMKDADVTEDGKVNYEERGLENALRLYGVWGSVHKPTDAVPMDYNRTYGGSFAIINDSCPYYLYRHGGHYTITLTGSLSSDQPKRSYPVRRPCLVLIKYGFMKPLSICEAFDRYV